MKAFALLARAARRRRARITRLRLRAVRGGAWALRLATMVVGAAAIAISATKRTAGAATGEQKSPPPDPPGMLVLAPGVRDSINAIFLRFNVHWNELAETNTLTQMLGTGRPTQREYLGCLVGHAHGDTVWVTGWQPARDLKQLQFAVTGSCDQVARLVGAWHTHPYRAGPDGHALKENALSAHDLATFAAGQDRAVIAAWDVDSMDAAVRGDDGAVHHPAAVVVQQMPR
jgi:hypothetical protein